MPITTPQPKNYGSPLIAFPSFVLNEPTEGRKFVSCEIPWTDDFAGTGKSVLVDMQFNATLAFSQITALQIDNSQCGSDIQFVFRDTGEVVTIPAYSPYDLVPVLTNNRAMTVTALGPVVLDTDVTRFQILNHLPPPVTVSTSDEQNIIATNSIAFVPSTTALLPATVNGRMEFAQIILANKGSAEDFKFTVTITDGSAGPRVLGRTQVNLANTNGFNGIILDLQSTRLRFSSGLNLVIAAVTGTLAEGTLSVNVGYRRP